MALLQVWNPSKGTAVRAAKGRLCGCAGQGTVEFALVAAAMVAVVVAGWHLLEFFAGGALSEHAFWSASHYLGASPTGVLADILAV